jgi:tRNA-dihydrouridine synthase B
MAGVTDKPFRMLCKRMGAGLCVSEMTTSDPRLWKTTNRCTAWTTPASRRRSACRSPAPTRVLAEAARWNVEHGAQIIDINMGCPAKKVCNVWAAAALLQDEALVARILEAVVRRSTCRSR